MTDNEIIEALELCSTPKGTKYTCAKCPFHEFGALCKVECDRRALDLINRQKAENEEFQKHIDNDIIYVKRVKAEAIKEFAERLNKEAEKVCIDREGDFAEADGEIYDTVADWCKKTSDNIVKEMVGEHHDKS